MKVHPQLPAVIKKLTAADLVVGMAHITVAALQKTYPHLAQNHLRGH